MAAARALLPAKSAFNQVGDMVILTARTLISALGPPYPYGEELVGQFLFVLKLSWFPLLISTFALCLGAPGLQAAGILSLFGALDRLGGFFVLTAIRWIGPLVTAVVVAGVAGTAITADLGARKIREELDALQVLGVDPIKNLVVPRFLALMVVTALLDIFAIVFGLTAGIAAELLYHQSLGGFFATLFSNASITDLWGSVLMCTMFGAIIAVVCCYKGMTASGGAAGRRPRRQPGGGDRLRRGLLLPLRLHRGPARHQPRTADDPDDRLARRPARLARLLRRDRPLRLARRRARLLGPGLPLLRREPAPGRHPDPRLGADHLGLRLHPRPPVRPAGRLLHPRPGRPLLRRALLRLLRPARGLPYAFGYILSAKVGTGIVAEIGAMRISDEIDALEVMGIQPVTFLCATRLLGAWIALPFLYLVGIGVMYAASYLSVVEQVGDVSSGGYLLIFWMFQNPPDLIFSLIKGMVMATVIVLVGCYYGYTASGGPVGVGTATAKSMVVNIVAVHIIGMLGTAGLLGRQPASADRRLNTGKDL